MSDNAFRPASLVLATVGLSLDEFAKEFRYLVEDEPPGLVLTLADAGDDAPPSHG